MENFIPLLCAIGFPIMWVFVSLLLSHISGWAKLAEHYTAVRDPPGETYSMRSGYVGSVRYKSCLTFRVCENGLRISVLFPFRVGHPPLFIPWDQFHGVSEKQVFFFRYVSADVGAPVVASVALPIWFRDHLPAENERYARRLTD